MSDSHDELVQALDRWSKAGRQATFWLRDDDAMEPSPALDRLLALSARYAVPVTLAVIPEHTGEALAEHLAARPLVDVAVHGWSHRNHAGPKEKKQELGLHRPESVVLGELASGRAKLASLYPERLVPVLVPPWNRISAPLVEALPSLGFAALSVFGPEKTMAIRSVNTHVDIMDWHGTRGGRSSAEVVPEIVRRLDRMFAEGGTMGLLTHHLVHDLTAWALIEDILDVTTRHKGCSWVSLGQIIAVA